MKLSLKQTVFLGLGILVLGIAISVGFFSWRSYVIKAQEQRSFITAKHLIKQSRANEALAIIKTMKGASAPENTEKWLSLEIQALEQSRNIPRLLYLYGQFPIEVLKHEKASILVARALLETKKTDLFSHLRESWRLHEKSPYLWFALDVDALLIQGKQNDALALLNSRSFKGPEDCGRLIRLALFKAGDNRTEAWNLLDEAYRADPRNADVRSFRAQILEYEGKESAARMEYIAAHLCDPDNPLLRDQLADFYRRQGNYAFALQTWIDGLASPVPDFYWIKALFWTKVTHPLEINREKACAPSGEMVPVIKLLQNLKTDTFWDDKFMQEEVNLKKLAETRQEIFWLRLLQALHEGSEARAMELLKTSPFKNTSFHPELERTLQIILVYRRWGVFIEPENLPSKDSNILKHQHQFFNQISLLARKNSGTSQIASIPQDLDNLLKSKEVFSAAFLAAGWLEAALHLHSLPVIPESFPDWIAYGFTQALRYNKGNKAALDYADRQKSTPALEMLVSEILLADNHPEKALPKLHSLAQTDNDIGFRAAWLMSIASLNKGAFEESRQNVLNHKSLFDSVAGKEILAKIALNEGNVGEADRLYGSLAAGSLEAKAYLARRAFDRKDWKTARMFTEDLIKYFPDMMELRNNIERIAREEKNGRP